MKEKIKKKFNLIFTIIIFSFIIFLISFLISKLIFLILPDNVKQFLSILNKEDLKELLNEAKLYLNNSYLIFIILQISQVILVPIPGQIVGILGGFIFGFIKGLTLTMIGITIGSLVSLLIGRYFSKILPKILSKELIKKFEFLVENSNLSTFFIIFLLPAFPDDAICFIAGLTRLNLLKLLLVSFLGRLPGMALLTFLGSSIDSNLTYSYIIFSIFVIISFFIWLFDKELKNYFLKFIEK
ncbi:MAG: hypothetical protein KatS3mg068_0007 [Candidatus Sericytochromatia bacterium]|nr:MAG: hypothetical protein KatS3mg068_0007 [Candidatus Sericytochromatia bacterium]